jgi:type I restriction enzyme S subunit
MRNVSQESVLDVVIPLAPASECLELVEAVEDQLSVIEHLEADLEAKLKSAQALRQSILRHAFTGQLVPQDPNDESAAELLKRIAAQREERARQAQTAKQTRSKPASKKSKTPLNKSARHP